MKLHNQMDCEGGATNHSQTVNIHVFPKSSYCTAHATFTVTLRECAVLMGITRPPSSNIWTTTGSLFSALKLNQHPHRIDSAFHILPHFFLRKKGSAFCLVVGSEVHIGVSCQCSRNECHAKRVPHCRLFSLPLYMYSISHPSRNVEEQRTFQFRFCHVQRDSHEVTFSLFVHLRRRALVTNEGTVPVPSPLDSPSTRRY